MNTGSILRKSAASGILFAIAAILAGMLALSIAPAQDAYAATKGMSLSAGKTFVVDGNKYKVTDPYEGPRDPGEVVLIKYGSSKTKPTINTVTYEGKKYEVEAIGRNAFNNAKGHKVTRVTIGRNVDTIHARAFYGCSKLAVLDISKSEVIDIDYSRRTKSYYIDEIEVGAQAFAKAGTKNIKVKCGFSSEKYKKVMKRALVSKGMRSTVKVVR